jgi:hypothetical protein
MPNPDTPVPVREESKTVEIELVQQPVPNGGRLDERKFERENTAKTRELDLREREVAVKEREVSSRWGNPIVLGLFATALGLAGNVWVAHSNNTNTLEVERQRSQSSLVLEAIRTGGNADATCKNLVFFVELGLVDDTNQTSASNANLHPKACLRCPLRPREGDMGYNHLGRGHLAGCRKT